MKLRHGLLVALVALAVVTVATDTPSELRALIVLPLILCGPGLAWSWTFRTESDQMEWVLLVALSVAVEILAGLVLMGLNRWTPDSLLPVVALIMAAGLITELTLSRAPRGSTP